MGSFNTGLAIAERLLKDVEKEKEALREFATPAKPRLSIEPDSPQMGILGDALMKGMTASAMRANVDPIQVVDDMIANANPGRIILADMLSGLGEALSGRPFQMTRQRLMAREITRAELNNQRDRALGQVFGQILDYQQGIAAVESQNRSDAIRAQGAILGVAEGRLQREEDLQNRIEAQVHQGEVTRENQIHAREQAVIRQELINGLVPQGLHENVERFAIQMTDPTLSEKQREFAQGRYQTLREAELKMLQEDEELKARTANRFKVRESAVQIITTKRDTPFGKQTVLQAINKDNGQRIWAMNAGVELSDDYIKQRDSAFKQHETLTELEGLVSGLDSTAVTALKNTTAKFFEAASLGPEKLEKFIEEQNFKPGSTEARVFQLMNELTAARVVEFTGAQATDNEREFIKTTMPQLFSNASTFKGGIALLRLYADFKGRRIQEHLTESTESMAFGETDDTKLFVKPFDVGGSMAEITQRLEENPNFLEGKDAAWLLNYEIGRRARVVSAQ